MAGCGKKIQEFVQCGYSYKEITVRCGNTSPHGTPWLCEKCEKTNANRDWRQEAIESGEYWDRDDY